MVRVTLRGPIGLVFLTTIASKIASVSLRRGLNDKTLGHKEVVTEGLWFG